MFQQMIRIKITFRMSKKAPGQDIKEEQHVT